AEKVPLVVGHAYSMRLIHGAKAKNDRIDAHKIARLLRGGNFPPSYVYPKGVRATRDLLRRRSWLVRHRAGLITHQQILNAQYNLRPSPKGLPHAGNRLEMDVPARFAEPTRPRYGSGKGREGTSHGAARVPSCYRTEAAGDGATSPLGRAGRGHARVSGARRLGPAIARPGPTAGRF